MIIIFSASQSEIRVIGILDERVVHASAWGLTHPHLFARPCCIDWIGGAAVPYKLYTKKSGLITVLKIFRELSWDKVTSPNGGLHLHCHFQLLFPVYYSVVPLQSKHNSGSRGGVICNAQEGKLYPNQTFPLHKTHWSLLLSFCHNGFQFFCWCTI